MAVKKLTEDELRHCVARVCDISVSGWEKNETALMLRRYGYKWSEIFMLCCLYMDTVHND